MASRPIVRSLVYGLLGPLVPLAVVACSKPSSNEPHPDAGASHVNVGVSLPLTGAFFGVGRPLKNAALVASAQINAAGGILGRAVDFNIEDDQSDKGQASIVVDDLLAAHPAGVLGPLASSQVLSVQEELYRRQVVEITAWATSPLLTTAQPPKDRFLFMTVPPDTFQARILARLMYDGVPRTGGAGDAGVAAGGCRVASFVNTNDAYGSALARLAKEAFLARQGAQIATDDEIDIELAQGYGALATKIVASHPDCLALVAHAETGARVERDLKAAIATDQADWSRFFIAASDATYDPEFLVNGQKDPTDPKSENVTLGTYGQVADTTPDTADYHAFEALYHTQFPGKEPGAFAANEYDAAILLALAIEEAGTTDDGVKIRDALFNVSRNGEAFGPANFDDAVVAIRRGDDIDYSGASGNVDFDDLGAVVADYIVWHVEKKSDGTYSFVTVGRVPASEVRQ